MRKETIIFQRSGEPETIAVVTLCIHRNATSKPARELFSNLVVHFLDEHPYGKEWYSQSCGDYNIGDLLSNNQGEFTDWWQEQRAQGRFQWLDDIEYHTVNPGDVLPYDWVFTPAEEMTYGV